MSTSALLADDVAPPADTFVHKNSTYLLAMRLLLLWCVLDGLAAALAFVSGE